VIRGQWYVFDGPLESPLVQLIAKNTRGVCIRSAESNDAFSERTKRARVSPLKPQESMGGNGMAAFNRAVSQQERASMRDRQLSHLGNRLERNGDQCRLPSDEANATQGHCRHRDDPLCLQEAHERPSTWSLEEVHVRVKERQVSTATHGEHRFIGRNALEKPIFGESIGHQSSCPNGIPKPATRQALGRRRRCASDRNRP